MSPVRLRFQSPHSPQTLAEGLDEYFSANPQLKRDAELVSPQARQFFRSHDAVHVVYGCGTSMADEAIVKLASLFGTTGGRQVLRGYVHRETLDIYRRLRIGSTLMAVICAPWLIARTVWCCARQRRRWPWLGYEVYLDVPLREIRASFGIKVAHPQRGTQRPSPAEQEERQTSAGVCAAVRPPAPGRPATTPTPTAPERPASDRWP